MNPIYPSGTVADLASSTDESERERRMGNLLYQAATVLAILLFLISF